MYEWLLDKIKDFFEKLFSLLGLILDHSIWKNFKKKLLLFSLWQAILLPQIEHIFWILAHYLHITKIVSNDNKGNLVSVLFRYNRPKLYCNLMLISNASGFSSKYNLTEQYTPKVYPWGTSIHRFHYIHHNTMLNFLV